MYGTVGGLAEYAALNGYQINASPALLSRASRVLDSLYGALFMGEPISYDAAWPRRGIDGLTDGTIPLRVIEATYELAIMEGVTPGTFDTIMTAPKTGPVVREKAGEVEIAYADPSKAYGFSLAEYGRPVFIDGLLAPFISKNEGVAVYVV